MASTIFTVENKEYKSSYPQKHTKLSQLKNQEAVFITARVKSVEMVKPEQAEGEIEREPTPVIELEDETGQAQLLIRHSSKLDSPEDKQAQEKTHQFFKDNVNRIVHILNTRVKIQKKNNLPKILLDKWSQLRVVFDPEVIKMFENPVQNPEPQQEQQQETTKRTDKKPKGKFSNQAGTPNDQASERPKREKKVLKERKEKELEFTNLWDITPNFTRSISVKGKVVNLVEFKKLKGFLPDNSDAHDEEGNPKAPIADSILVTLADLTGKIYGVFPNLPKFSQISKGAILSFIRGKIDRFDGDVKGDLQIYLTTFLKDEKRSKYKGEIQVLTAEQEPELDAIPLENESEAKDAKNVSNKVWVIETPRE